MNVFNKVTFNSLKKNHTRTIVTIIGVILSAAMITAVTTFISSLQNYMVQNVISVTGDWYIEFISVNSSFTDKISKDKEVENIAVSQNLGYALLEGGKNDYKPYLYITAFDDNAFDTIPVRLLTGRLPQNDGEIVIPVHIDSNGGVNLKIGDTLTLTIGDRIMEGEKLGQKNPFSPNYNNSDPYETFETKITKTYTVVGICERLGFEGYSAPGYTVITWMNAGELSGTDEANVFVKLKHPSRVYDFSESIAGDFSYTYNSELLRYVGVSNNDAFNSILYSLGGILIALIMIGSVLLIYNSFSISVSERTRQFGILSSVGATGKQLRKSVMFEGACIGFIGIPLGILAGISGIGITLSLVSGIFENMSSTGVPMMLSVSLPSVVIAGIVGIVTILISAYIPAKKAAKLTAIEAIRQTTDIKIKAKNVKTSGFIQLLFGLEGTLARKNFKRDKKKYRSTIISLFVSIVLFISAGSFSMNLRQGTRTSINRSGYDIMFNYNGTSEESLYLYEKMKNVSGVYDSGFYETVDYRASVAQEELTKRYIEYYFGDSLKPDEMAIIHPTLIFIDDETYAKYIKELGLDSQKYTTGDTINLIASAKINQYDISTGRYISFDIFKNGTPLFFQLTSTDGTESIIEITVTHIAEKMPEAISESRGTGFYIYVPYSLKDQLIYNDMQNRNLTSTFLSKDPNKSTEEMKAILKDMDIYSGYSLYNIAEAQESTRQLLLLIDVFTYGFIVLISLITIANVFNTISTNINLRRREFAMLKSVGMTDKGFNKMMVFECLFYGLKSLLYGLPVAFFISYLIYKGVIGGVDITFDLPWTSVGVSVFSVFLIVFVTMMYSISKVKKENTVDALKNDIL